MDAPVEKTKWRRLPSAAQGAIGYLVALLLAVSFRHVVLGMDRLASDCEFPRLICERQQKAVTLTNVRLS